MGTIIGPAIGGTLARPSQAMPSLFSSTGLFAKFPYLLPNLVCAGLMLVSVIFGYFFLEESHPDMQRHATPDYLGDSTAETPLMVTGGTTTDPGVDLRSDTYGTFNEVEITEEKEWLLNADGSSRPASISSCDPENRVFTRKIAMILVALCLFTYHCMTYDHLLPVFLQDDRIEPSKPITPFSIPGGLGFSTTDVGIIMSINGIIALLIQAVIFPLVTSWLGVWNTFVVVTLLHPIEYFIVPYLAFLPAKTLYAGIYTCLTIRQLTTILAYPVILILLKEAVTSPSCLGKVNGLAASAGAACRTIAPPIAGYLYGAGASLGFTGLAWWGSGFVALIGVLQILVMKRTKNKTATIRPMAPFIQNAMPEERSNEVVHIVVREGEV